MNVAVLTGRLTSDPELRKTPNGVSVARFTIAVDRNYTPKGEEKKVDFLDCVAWRNDAEFICNYFVKGQMIAVSGEIQTGSFEKDGIKRKKWEVKVDHVSFCGSKAEGNNQAAPNNQAEFSNSTPDFEEVLNDDDLPF